MHMLKAILSGLGFEHKGSLIRSDYATIDVAEYSKLNLIETG